MRVRTVPVQPHCFLYGGFDIQMVRTLEILQSVGIDARPLDFWSREEQFEILHIWGLEYRHREIMRIAKSYGKKVVMSPLLPYLTPRTYVSYLLGRTRKSKEILKYVDLMLVVNELQAETAVKIFGFPRELIEIVPTILDPKFFDLTRVPELSDEHSNYVVCAGNILPRKNQVRLARAALEIGCKVDFIGNIMGGDEAYAEEFEKTIEGQPSIRWHKWLSWNDLHSTVLNATAIALPSLNECQPASGLEAVALQKPLLIANRPYAHQKFYDGAVLVNPKSVKSISDGLLKIINCQTKFTKINEHIQECNPARASIKLQNIFKNLNSKN